MMVEKSSSIWLVSFVKWYNITEHTSQTAKFVKKSIYKTVFLLLLIEWKNQCFEIAIKQVLGS